MAECEACRNGIGEPWEKFTEGLAGVSPKSLEEAWITWWKKAVDYHLARCRKHAEEASDRRDYLSAERNVGLFSSGKMTPSLWLEGRNEIRGRGGRFSHPSGVHDPPDPWEELPRVLVEYRMEELDTFCYQENAKAMASFFEREGWRPKKET